MSVTFTFARIVRAAFIVLLALQGWQALHAEDGKHASKANRPKIGLVLSGGGAKGAAHIGALKILEQNNIPIDMVAGTSFGAIVGGLYASGYSATELEAILNDIDWQAVLSSRAPRKDRSFRRKQDDDGFLIKFRMGLKKGKLTLPSGLVEPNNLRLLLQGLIAEKLHVHDYDNLAIPFRAVATDLSTGDAVLLGDGDLASSIVASMAVPALFPPVDHDGRLLVDGGVANNVPIDVARAMGADIVIVIDISARTKTKAEITSFTSVISQLTLLMTAKNTAAQLATLTEQDIVIRPDLNDIGLVDFDRTGDAIIAGEQAANAVVNQLRQLSLSPDDWSRHIQARLPRESEPFRVNFIRIANSSRISDDVIKARLSTKPGDILSSDLMTQDLTAIFGMEIFDEVTYREVEEDGKTGVEVVARGQERGNNNIRFGLTLREDFEGESAYQVAAGFNNLAINSIGGEVQALFQVGNEFGLFTEIYQPLDLRERYYIFANVTGKKFNQNILSSDERGELLAQQRISTASFGLGAGRNFGKWGTASVGLIRSYSKVRGRIGVPSDVSVPIDQAALFARFTIDTVDNLLFPHSGTIFSVNYANNMSFLSGDSRVDSISIGGYQPFSWGKNTLGFNYQFATTFNGTPNETNLFPLGGFMSLTAYVEGQLTGNHGGSVAAVYYRKIGGGTGFLAQTPLYLGGTIEAGNVWNSHNDISLSDLRWSSSLFIGADSPLGPVYLGAGIGSDSQYSAFLYVGQLF